MSSYYSRYPLRRVIAADRRPHHDTITLTLECWAHGPSSRCDVRQKGTPASAEEEALQRVPGEGRDNMTPFPPNWTSGQLAVCFSRKDAYQLAKDRRALASESGHRIAIRVVPDRLEMDLVNAIGRPF